MMRLAIVAALSLAGVSLAAQQGTGTLAAPPSAGTLTAQPGAGTPAAPQGVGGGTDLASIPVDQEPRHHVVFTNDFVRIIDATLPPLYVSERHTHSADNVAVTIQMTSPPGQSRVGFASFARGGYSHIITNPTVNQMRFIDVELRAADRGESVEEPEPSGHEVVLSNARVRVSRVTLDAGASLDEHQHASGYVSVVIRGGEGLGVWHWHPSGEPASALKSGRTTLEMVEIEPR